MIDATHPARPDLERSFCQRNRQARKAVINRIRQLSLDAQPLQTPSQSLSQD